MPPGHQGITVRGGAIKNILFLGAGYSQLGRIYFALEQHHHVITCDMHLDKPGHLETLQPLCSHQPYMVMSNQIIVGFSSDTDEDFRAVVFSYHD